MNLSPIGEMVYQEWNISFEMLSELFCEAFIIMSNHLNAILRIDKGASTDSKKMDGILEIIGTYGRAPLRYNSNI